MRKGGDIPGRLRAITAQNRPFGRSRSDGKSRAPSATSTVRKARHTFHPGPYYLRSEAVCQPSLSQIEIESNATLPGTWFLMSSSALRSNDSGTHNHSVCEMVPRFQAQFPCLVQMMGFATLGP